MGVEVCGVPGGIAIGATGMVVSSRLAINKPGMVYSAAKVREVYLPETLKTGRAEKNFHQGRLSTFAEPIIHDDYPRPNGMHECFRIRVRLSMTGNHE